MSEERKGLEELQSLLIRKLSLYRIENVRTDSTGKQFSTSEEIRSIEAQLAEVKVKIRRLDEEELAPLRDQAETIINYCVKAYSTADPQQSLKGLLQLSKRFIKLWEAYFPDSRVPGWLTNEHLNTFEGLAGKELTIQDWQEKIRKELLLPFQADIQYEILESLNSDKKRAELESTALQGVSEQERLEKAYASFTRLKFDSLQRKEFNELYRASQKIQYFIHGEPTHGQRWLYNRIIRLHRFFESDSGIGYYPFKLDGPLGDEDVAAVISKELKVEAPPDTKEAWYRAVADNIIKKLQHQHVLFAFLNPDIEKLPAINRLAEGILEALGLESSLAEHKAIFITLLDQVVASLPIPCLQPIGAGTFREWIGSGKEDYDEYIMAYFGNLPEEDEGRLCDALIKIHGVGIPSVPAEKFIENVAVEKFNLKWEKCKDQWLRY